MAPGATLVNSFVKWGILGAFDKGDTNLLVAPGATLVNGFVSLMILGFLDKGEPYLLVAPGATLVKGFVCLMIMAAFDKRHSPACGARSNTSQWLCQLDNIGSL